MQKTAGTAGTDESQKPETQPTQALDPVPAVLSAQKVPEQLETFVHKSSADSVPAVPAKNEVINPEFENQISPGADTLKNSVATEDVDGGDRTTHELKVGDTVCFLRDVQLGDIDPSAEFPANLIAKTGEFAEVKSLYGGYTLGLWIIDREFRCLARWVERVDAQANADLLRECIADKSWEMIKELTESWPQNFKKSEVLQDNIKFLILSFG